MAKRMWLLLPVLVLSFAANAQSKVANYSFGEGGTKQYEHFSFWVKDKQSAEVTYSYGADGRETAVTYSGKTNYKNQPGFTVRFANGYTLYIVPKGKQLLVSDLSGKYNKTFTWEYEGPVNGIGTFCDVCAQDEEEAMTLIRSAYLK